MTATDQFAIFDLKQIAACLCRDFFGIDHD
jgi:hypothetical protein